MSFSIKLWTFNHLFNWQMVFSSSFLYNNSASRTTFSVSFKQFKNFSIGKTVIIIFNYLQLIDVYSHPLICPLFCRNVSAKKLYYCVKISGQTDFIDLVPSQQNTLTFLWPSIVMAKNDKKIFKVLQLWFCGEIWNRKCRNKYNNFSF